MFLLKRPLFAFACTTHQGAVRSNNEDEVRELVADTESPWAWGVLVADGMGGGSGGEVASRTVADVVSSRIALWRVSDPALLGARWAAQYRKHLTGVVHDAHDALLRKVEKDESLHGMGSTLVALLAFQDCCAVIHCGDSRAFLVRDGAARQLTVDHTWAEQERRRGVLADADIESSPLAPRLVRIVGGPGDGEAEVSFVRIRQGDLLVACSDGLTKHVGADELWAEVMANPDPQGLATRLVARAIEHGGTDNIAVGVLRVMRAPPRQLPASPDEGDIAEKDVTWLTRPGAEARDSLTRVMNSDRSATTRRRTRRAVLAASLGIGAVGALTTSIWLWAAENERYGVLGASGGRSVAVLPASPSESASLAFSRTESGTSNRPRKERRSDEERPGVETLHFVGATPSRSIPKVAGRVAEAVAAGTRLGDSAVIETQRLLDSVRAEFSEMRELRRSDSLANVATRAEAERRRKEEDERNARRAACDADRKQWEASRRRIDEDAKRLKVVANGENLDQNRLSRARDAAQGSADKQAMNPRATQAAKDSEYNRVRDLWDLGHRLAVSTQEEEKIASRCPAIAR